MLDAVRKFFERQIGSGDAGAGQSDARRVQIATAALLFEMMRMDERFDERERTAAIDAVQRTLGVGAAETSELLQLAEAQARQATDYFQFTSLINQSFTPEQKENIVEQLWRVAYADGNLNRYEEHLARKIAELLYVPHSSFIAAKLRARDRSGSAPQ